MTTSSDEQKKISSLLLSGDEGNIAMALEMLVTLDCAASALTELFVVWKLTKRSETQQKAAALLDTHATAGVRAAMQRQLKFTSDNNISKYVKSSRSELDGLKLARGLYSHVGVGFNFIMKKGSPEERLWLLRQFVKDKTLQLRGKGLTSIPREVYELTDLEEIDLGRNKITNISSKFKAFKKLRVLNLENNKLKKIHAALASLPHLEELNLSNNLIEVFPAVLGEMTALRRLNIMEMLNVSGSVGTVDLPEGFWRLTLTELHVSSNSYNHYRHGYNNIPFVSTLKAPAGEFLDLTPLAMAKLHFESGLSTTSVYYLLQHAEPAYRRTVLQRFYDAETKTLDLSRVRITCLPPELAELDIVHFRMEDAGFGYNRRPGDPDAESALAVLGELKALETLSLADNAMSAIPMSVFQCTALKWLSLEDVRIRSVQPEIGALENLEYLNLNGATWDPVDFPPAVQKLTRLKELHIAHLSHKTPEEEQAYITHLQERFPETVSIPVLDALRQRHGR